MHKFLFILTKFTKSVREFLARSVSTESSGMDFRRNPKSRKEILKQMQDIPNTIVRQRVSSPPTDAEIGDRFLVDQGAVQHFAGYENHIATKVDATTYEFRLPENGEILQILEGAGTHEPATLVYFPAASGTFFPFAPLTQAPQVVTADGGQGTITADQLDGRQTFLKLFPTHPWAVTYLPAATEVPEHAVTVLNLSPDKFAVISISGGGQIQGSPALAIRPLGALQLLAVGGGLQGKDWAVTGGTYADQVAGDGPVLRFTNLGSEGGFWEAAMHPRDGSFRFFSYVDNQPSTPLRIGAMAEDNLLLVGFSDPETVTVSGTLRLNGVNVEVKLNELEQRLQAIHA